VPTSKLVEEKRESHLIHDIGSGNFSNVVGVGNDLGMQIWHQASGTQDGPLREIAGGMQGQESAKRIAAITRHRCR
jgi:hypothetical protein